MKLKFQKKSIEVNNASLPVPKNRWDDKGLKEVLLSNHGIWSDIKIVEKSCTGLGPKKFKHTIYYIRYIKNIIFELIFEIMAYKLDASTNEKLTYCPVGEQNKEDFIYTYLLVYGSAFKPRFCISNGRKRKIVNSLGFKHRLSRKQIIGVFLILINIQISYELNLRF